ncbi:T9SS type A sorting domain-containing protein [Spirosoma sp. HMF4905]|uniref:T9SS type A sorting domain-containing protein n=1 Tax=Spirosoma arboris TaxID=2682092 RepID=A0A7K1SEY9_9BACT|nr:T9SS type A sorting domain-containing protein [Spirosoma arboris]MVM32293.1 T9SS type A sorting domain-containing protein [Spirosoma arboris]
MRKILFFLAICFNTMAQTLDQQQTAVNGAGSFGPEGLELEGQTFTAGVSGPLTQITLKLGSGTGSTYTTTLRLYATDQSGLPVLTTVLASATATVSGPIPDFLNFSEFNFVFDSPYSITINTKYAFTISAPPDVSAQVASYSRDRYDRGNQFIKFYNSSINVLDISDLYFETYVTGPLPVRLVSFTAREVNAQSVLEWQTSLESNTSHFEVQRSQNARSFETIGRVSAIGNSTTQQSYLFRDEDLTRLPSVVYYRLHSVDLDGSYSDSKIISLTQASTFSRLHIYPNPVVSGGSVRINAPLGDSQVSVRNLTGQRLPVQISNPESGKTELNLGSLPSGIYILNMIVKEGSQTQKLLIE